MSAKRVVIDLPDDDSYVVFSEGGAGHPSRLIIQFRDGNDMNRAHASLTSAIAKAAREQEQPQ